MSLFHLIGLDSGSGPFYLFWSGFGGDFGEVTLLTGVIVMLRTHNCHVKGCWRLGKYSFEHYKLCKKHHPNTPQTITHLHITKLNKEIN